MSVFALLGSPQPLISNLRVINPKYIQGGKRRCFQTMKRKLESLGTPLSMKKLFQWNNQDLGPMHMTRRTVTPVGGIMNISRTACCPWPQKGIKRKKCPVNPPPTVCIRVEKIVTTEMMQSETTKTSLIVLQGRGHWVTRTLNIERLLHISRLGAEYPHSAQYSSRQTELLPT